MEYEFLTVNWKYARWLLTAFIAAVTLTIAAPSLHAANASGPRESFVALDSEVQAIKAEILAINRELLMLEESSLFLPGEQLVVVVSVTQDSELNPQLVSLQLDGQLLTRHNYTLGESAALQAGGVHRLYAGLLSEGEHRLEVTLSGTHNRDKPFQQKHSTTISKTPGRKYIELQLAPGKKKHQPALTIRQWRP